MSLRHRIKNIQAYFLLFLSLASFAFAGSATNITGLYYTGLNSSGGLQTGGGLDANWNVTYASYDGGTSTSSASIGDAYVVSSSYVPADYVANTSSAKWITAPGARTTTSNTSPVNVGGTNLPGNGNSGSNKGIYIYTLAFNISGTGTGDVTNKVMLSLTVAADDQVKIYVNPTGDGTSLPTTTAALSYTSAWTNTNIGYLANYKYNSSMGSTGNATFKIGMNYLVAVVDNTNSINGSSNSTALNPTGFIMYQVGSVATIDGKPVPEMAPWMPMASALGLYGLVGFFRKRRQTAAK